MQGLEFFFAGTRGSLPASGPSVKKYGGHTTCLRVKSSAIPSGMALLVDAGSGVYPEGGKILSEGISTVNLLLTHPHYDHIEGLRMSPITYVPTIKINVYGPVDNRNFGPREMLEHYLFQPLHPVEFKQVACHFEDLVGIENPMGYAFVLHPEGGLRFLRIDILERAEANLPHQLEIGEGHYPLEECLVIRMYRANHPQRTISYRFEDRPTGKVAVFMTDHENLGGLPNDLMKFLHGVDFLVMDCQYTAEAYIHKAGFGHATPDHVATVAASCKPSVLGVTHHDCGASDKDVDAIVAETKRIARELGFTGEVMGMADYDLVEVS